VEKRRTRKGKKKDKQRKHTSETSGPDGASTIGEGNEGERQSSSESDSSSCDDSFVRYEMRPVFATGSDLGAFFNQCKSAPPDLKSFTTVFAQPLSAMPAPIITTESTTAAAAAAAVAFVRRSLEEIPEHLKLFEEKQKVFDDFVKSLKVDSSSEDEPEDGNEGKRRSPDGGGEGGDA